LNSERRNRLHAPGATGLFRNSLFVLFGQGSVGLLFITYIIAARLLGDAGFGEFSLGLTIAAVLITIPAWGSSRYASIAAARDPARTEELIATYFGLTIPLAFLYFPAVGAVALLISGPGTIPVIALLLGADMLAREVGNAIRTLFRVHDAYHLETLTAFVERGAIVVGAAIVLILRPDPVLLAAAFAAGRGCGALITALIFRRRVCRIGAAFDTMRLRQLFVLGTPLALRRAVSLLTFRVDMLFLGGMRSSQEVGWYGSIFTFMDGVIMMPNSVTGSIGPTLSANFGEGRREVVDRLYQRGLKYLLIVGIFLGAVFLMLADAIVAIVYGAEFAPAAIALKILSIGVLFMLLRGLTTEVLDNVDLRGASLRVFVVGLVTNVVLNIILVPRYGYLGAAASTVVTEAILMGGMMWALSQAGYASRFLHYLRAPALAIAAPLSLMWVLAGTPVLAGLAAAVTYFLGLTLFGAWDDKDRSLVANILSRRKGA
jgi:O-antigen/teichoic acid export membrane protein